MQTLRYLTKTEYTSREDVESQIIKETEKIYHQTETGGCQFLTKEFRGVFGEFGEGPATQEVLDGTFEMPDNTTEATSDFLRACQYADGAATIHTDLPIETRYHDYANSWKVRKEKTTSYNHHIMGHYKSVMTDEYLSWFFFQASEIPEISGYSPDSYRQCADLTIPKKAMDFELSKHRTIGLLDTRFNHMNKRIGYSAMNNAIKLDSLAVEQFSRPGRSAIGQCISKRCTIDHHASRRLTFAMTSCDLAGCYDRIVHTAAALALLRIGVPHAKIECMFSTIQRMVHRVRTAFGDSEGTYGGDDYPDWLAAPQGALQGNAGGPTIWAVLSSVIFKVLGIRGFSSHFCSAISKQLLMIVGYSFVDDCDLFQSGEDPLTVLQSMQELINSWGELVEVTGGALRPDKSWWYLVEYVWSRGKWRGTNARDDLDLVATAPNGEVVSLKRLHVDEAAEMLGVWMAPSGNNKKIVSTLKRQSLEWAAKVRLGRPSQEEAMVALKVNVSARLRYPLSCCTLTEKECKSIMYPAVRAALGKAGIASNISTRARDGPVTSGGAGIISLFHYQGTSRIAAMVEHVVRRTPTGIQIIMCIEDLVLDTGYYGRLWDMPFETYSKYVSQHSWIYSICEYAHEHGIEINCDHAVFSPKREGDKSIMEVGCHHFSRTADLKAINRVRQFHGVIHLSDLASADGRYLNPEFLSRGQFDGRRNDYLWPTRHHVTPADYTVWRKAMDFLFPVTGLQTPLRHWTLETAEHWLQHWDWFTTRDRTLLFRQIGENEWRRHVRVQGTQRSYHQAYLRVNEPPPPTVLRATVRELRDTWILTNTHFEHTIQQDNRTPEFTFDAIQVAKPKLDWFFQHFDSSCSTSNLLAHIIAGTAIAVSDGSFYEEYNIGACGWIIATPDAEEWIEGGGLVPDASDSYRTELAGQLGIAAFLESIIIDNLAATPTITVSCDGLSALNRTGLSLDALRASNKHMDLISMLSHLWDIIPYTIAREHVYGHQDDLRDRVLTILEWLNCKMDHKAKRIALEQIDRRRNCRFSSTQLGFGTIKCHGSMVISHIQKSLYDRITHKDFVERLGEKLHIEPDLLDTRINWKAYGKARKAELELVT